jgi:hypothetical protein
MTEWEEDEEYRYPRSQRDYPVIRNMLATNTWRSSGDLPLTHDSMKQIIHYMNYNRHYILTVGLYNMFLEAIKTISLKKCYKSPIQIFDDHLYIFLIDLGFNANPNLVLIYSKLSVEGDDTRLGCLRFLYSHEKLPRHVHRYVQRYLTTT